jgi:ATP-binding cassette subfamily F protein uup
MAALNKEKLLITEKLGSSNLPFEELQKNSQRIVEITNLLDKKELRWLELSEMIEGI